MNFYREYDKIIQRSCQFNKNSTAPLTLSALFAAHFNRNPNEMLHCVIDEVIHDWKQTALQASTKNFRRHYSS